MSDIKNETTQAEPIEADESAEDAEVVEVTFVVEGDLDETVPSDGEVDQSEPEAPDVKPQSKGASIWPVIAGGVIAGAIGFGTATYLNIGSGSQNDALAVEFRAQFEAQSEQIETLSAEISRIEDLTDTSAVQSRLQAVEAQVQSGLSAADDGLTEDLSGLASSISTLEQRVSDVEKRPMAETISEGAVAAYEAEMTALRAAIATHRADIENMAADARAMEVAAKEDAVRSDGTSWLTDINVALMSGAPFDQPLAKLAAKDIAIPDGLSASANDGVSTQAELTEAFPAAAREALSAIRSDAVGEDGNSGFVTFLQNQLGARSVAPKDGDSADAILSRAEAATKDGDLIKALTELETLAPAGQPSLALWVSLANERLAAMSALEELREIVISK